jgi:uncharacterized DUF497 family protein
MPMPMTRDFEWDEDKNESNFDKHGIDFETAMLIWEGPVIEQVDDRKDYGESRFIALGMVEDRVLAVVYTWRGNCCRIISARKARKDERRAYRETLTGIGPDQKD